MPCYFCFRFKLVQVRSVQSYPELFDGNGRSNFEYSSPRADSRVLRETIQTPSKRMLRGTTGLYDFFVLSPLLIIEVTISLKQVWALASVVHVNINLALDLVVYPRRLFKKKHETKLTPIRQVWGTWAFWFVKAFFTIRRIETLSIVAFHG